MMLDPKIAQKLLSEVPEVAQLRDFLVQEAAKLDSLAGMANMTPEQRAVEVTARLRAKETIDAILGPLLNQPEGLTPPNPRDYTVEVEDLPGQKK